MKRPRGGPSRCRSIASIAGSAAPPKRSGSASCAVAAAPRVDLGLDRRRRRGEHDRDAGDAPAHHRHVAGVVVHAVLLLVGGVVLLIDDDEAEIGVRQEQRRARADHDRTSPAATAAQVRARLRGDELRMPFRRAHAEALRRSGRGIAR